MHKNSLTIIYLHGFQSSAKSQKAVYLQQFLGQLKETAIKNNACHYDLLLPDLPFSPASTIKKVEMLIGKFATKNNNVVLMGSSMGGFYADYLSQKHNLPAVLINPAISADKIFENLIGSELENIYTGEKYTPLKSDLDLLKSIANKTIADPTLIFNCLETGDEVLDYLLAKMKYKDCQQKIIEGGDHRFQSFELILPDMLAFYDQALARI